MGFSDRILGKKNVNGGPHIDGVSPSFALTGGEVRINGSGLRPQDLLRPKVKFGDVAAPIVVSSDGFLVTRVPEGAVSGPEIDHAPRGAKALGDDLELPARMQVGNVRDQLVIVLALRVDRDRTALTLLEDREGIAVRPVIHAEHDDRAHRGRLARGSP